MLSICECLSIAFDNAIQNITKNREAPKFENLHKLPRELCNTLLYFGNKENTSRIKNSSSTYIF